MKTALRLLAAMAGAVAVMGALSGCANEKELGPAPELSNTVTFQTSVPVNRSALTRALTYADEYAVETVDVLVFQGGKYLYTTPGNITVQPSAANATSNATMSFSASMATSSSASDLMVVANARTLISAAYKNGIPAGTSQDSVARHLLMTLPSGGWASSPAAAGYLPMPMWGYLTKQTINESYGANPHSMSMVRMQARVDVNVSASTFQLKRVHVYNYAAQGRLIPETSGSIWGGASPNLANYKTPSLPANYAAATGYIEYPTTGQSLKNAIYLFEEPVVSDNALKSPCIVIGGRYTGDTQDSYYRIDLKDTSGKFLPILRNNSYTVNVTGVYGTGFSSSTDAYNSFSSNLTANILVWQGGAGNTITEIVTGDYMLGVSSGKIALSSGAHTSSGTDNQLTVVTDAPGGWTATVHGNEEGTTTAPWLTLSVPSGTGNYSGGGNMTRLVTNENTTGADRTAYVHITAGRITYVVEVAQQRAPYVRIVGVTASSTLTFTSAVAVAPTSRTLTVEWFPADRPLTVVKTPGVKPFIWPHDSYSLVTIPAGGSYSFVINPPAITQSELDASPSLVKTSTLSFSVNGLTPAVSVSVDLKQQVTAP